jgi:hypothetical protein
MKTEPRATISGLKVAGLIALLASLLVLLPAASAASYSVQIGASVDDNTVYDGQLVTFKYVVKNAGDSPLDYVDIGGIAPTTTDSLEAGETVTLYEEYTVDLEADFIQYNGRYYLPNDVTATAYLDGQVVSQANSRCTLIGPKI